ncbi:head-tail connector protein [Pseudovibrio sp. Tun.PSC04-5.I4]|uniref:head-tail connector protein n=1 Tax=Pseudovibrio sp. Tun.PSC04-5.I4 TaxID=1798213 RepID=UPI00087E9116|nr:head-tail connector protein [Pseudovibrio sp. Tun.PSC04-5.I4]SDR19947.1 phage conserved hypothetical protein, phiE125 gp8 family [Pseudovibrio sp. Tun.PSC04-5.I4]
MDSTSIPTLKTAPATLPVSVADIKAHLAVDFDDNDDLIKSYLSAAVSRLDGYRGELKRCLINQTWEQSFCGWPCIEPFRLWFPDISRAQISYESEDGGLEQVDPSVLELAGSVEGSDLYLAKSFALPRLNAAKKHPVKIAYVTGFGEQPEDVPAAIGAAIKMMVGHMYNAREDVVIGSIAISVPHSSKFMLEPYRRFVW